MLFCANCDHLREEHDHYRAGTECAHVNCLCEQFADPRAGWLISQWRRLMRLGR